MKPSSEHELNSARWQAWRSTWRILRDPSIDPADKLTQCQSIYDWHASAHADLEVYPIGHPTRVMREGLLKRLPEEIKMAKVNAEFKRTGQTGLL